MDKRLILLELNELSHVLLHEYMEKGYLPNFKRLNDQSRTFLTDAKASGEYLNPWIQWVSVHTGLKAENHGIYRLDDLEGFSEEFIWDTLSKKGYKSWICGSMNAKVSSDFNGLFLPDPWSTGAAPFPKAAFETFFNFVRQAVLNNSSSKPVAAKDFVLYLLNNGLSLKTLVGVVKQLVSEKINPDLKWRRAMILDWLQLDLFKHHLKHAKPHLSIFFSNSTAHFQHHYWAGSQAGAGSNSEVSGGERLLAAYINHDKLLGECLKLQDDNTAIMFCTALSQERFTKEVKNYYHINSLDSFLQAFGVRQQVEYMPVMAEQFHLECKTADEALRNYEMKSDEYFHSGSKRVLSAKLQERKVTVKCRCSRDVTPDTQIVNIQDGTELRFGDIFYKMDDIKTGIHNPTGMLWYCGKDIEPVTVAKPIELEDIKPMIMDYFSAPAT